MTLRVDPCWAAYAAAPIPDGDALSAIKSAYNKAANQVAEAGRQAVLIEVTVRVAPQPDPQQS